MKAEISGGLYFLPRISTQAAPSSLRTTLYGKTLSAFCTSASSKRRPIKRLIANTVLVGLVIDWRLAIWPTSRSPASVNATTDGVVRLPSELAITTGSPPSMNATQLFVVPKSIPITFAIFLKTLSSRDNHASVTFNIGDIAFASASLSRIGPGLLRNRHAGRTQGPVTDQIAAMEFIDDGVRRMHLRRHVIDRFMPIGIERLADRLQRCHALRTQKIDQRPHRHLDAIDDRPGVIAIAGGPERALEVVDDRQQVAEDGLALDADRFLALLANSLARIFGVGERAKILVLQLGDFLVFFGDLRA